MKRIHLVLLFHFFAITGFSQNANPDCKRTRHWVFGEKNWIEWTDTGAMQHTGSKAIQTEEMAVFTDTSGNLQLYFDSKFIYDSSHNVIENGNVPGGNWSAHRGAIFVPHPGNDSLCYLFYTMASIDGTFAVCIINWQSKILINTEILLKSTIIEGIASTLHHNNIYYWVGGAKKKTDDLFFYLITDKGIFPCQFSQPNLCSYKSSSGQCGLSFSLSNKKIVNYDFDINRFQIADFNSFNSNIRNAYLKYTPGGSLLNGAEFSENDSFLYTQLIAYDGLRQYRLSNWSSILIDSNFTNPVKYSFGLCYLNNSQITTGYYGSQNTKDTNAMVLIDKINEVGNTVNFNSNWLKTKNRIKYSPPYFPYNFYRKYRSDFSYLTNCSNSSLDLKAIVTGAEKEILWLVRSPKNDSFNFIGKNFALRVADSGMWNVQMIAMYENKSDTVIKNVPIFTPFFNHILGPNIPVCNDSFNLKLSIPLNALCAKWENLSNSTFRSIDTFGQFSVLFYDSNYCYYEDTISVYKSDTLPKPNLLFTAMDSLSIVNYKPSQAWKFVFTNGIIKDTINWPNYKVNDTGLWTIEVISTQGCNTTKSAINISKLEVSNLKNLRFSIYPNPAEDVIIIEPSVINEFFILDIHGKLIESGFGNKFNISKLKSGMYIIRIQYNQQNDQLFKFIKL